MKITCQWVSKQAYSIKLDCKQRRLSLINSSRLHYTQSWTAKHHLLTVDAAYRVNSLQLNLIQTTQYMCPSTTSNICTPLQHLIPPMCSCAGIILSLKLVSVFTLCCICHCLVKAEGQYYACLMPFCAFWKRQGMMPPAVSVSELLPA